MKIYFGDTTTSIIDKTSEIVKNLIDNNQKCIVFAEDKITLSLEIEIAKKLGGGFFDVDVLTFKRYIAKHSLNSKVLSKESSVMLVRTIINELSSKLKCFSGSLLTPNMALVLYELISQLESAKVSPEQLKKLITEEKDINLALLNKLQDILEVYTLYDERVKEMGVYDSNDYLSLMPQIIKNDSEIKNLNVIVSGFSSVTRQRYDVFDSLYKNAKGFYAVVPYDETSDLYTGETFDRLKEIAANYEVVKQPSSSLLEVEYLKKYLFNPLVYAEEFKPLETNKVTLNQAENLSKECDWLAKDIFNEVKKGYRYKDISVVVGSLNDSLFTLSKTLESYNIPYYVERSTPLLEHPICDFITALLDFQRRGLNAKDFVRIISSSLFIIDKEKSDRLINHVYKNIINRKAFRLPFAFKDENFKYFENVRKIVVDITDKLAISKTARDFVNAIKYALNQTNAFENLNKLTLALKNSNHISLSEFNDRIDEKITNLLDEIERILGDSKITGLDFKNVFLSGALGTSISSIPIFNDAVYIGECKDVKIKSSKILYAISLNGDIPFTQSDTALLSDGDLAVLDGFNVIVEPKINLVNRREKENVLITLCSFTEKLKLSYYTQGGKGSVYKSDTIKYLSKMFNLTPISYKFNGGNKFSEEQIESISQAFANDSVSLLEIAKSYNDYQNSDEVANKKIESFYEAVKILNKVELSKETDELLKDKVDSKSINSGENLSISNGEISASVLESYFSCPYKNYASNVLKLKENLKLQIKANENGIILHEVSENYAKNISRVVDKESSDKLVEEIFEKLMEDENYKKYLQSPKLEFTLERLKKESKRVCYNVYNSIKNGKFVPKYFEKRFGRNEDVSPIKINADNKTYDIKGVVDRVDSYGDYIRVIDYKSGKIYENDENFYTGNKIQLYLYMNAFVNENVKPAGAYYYPIKDVYTEKEETYTMLGKTLNNDEVISATDSAFIDGNNSNIIKVKKNKDGAISKTSQVLTEDGLDSYLKYAKEIAKTGINEISSGYINPSPYLGACSYCEYGGMCRFCDEEAGKFRKVTGVTSETIISAVNDLENQGNKAENQDEK